MDFLLNSLILIRKSTNLMDSLLNSLILMRKSTNSMILYKQQHTKTLGKEGLIGKNKKDLVEIMNFV